MRILFFTACYKPILNGVVFSILNYKKCLEKEGHKVLVVAPKYPGFIDVDNDILRLPSLFNPFLPQYPIFLPFGLDLKKIEKFQPDIIHAHHPFVIGGLAKRTAKKLKRPLVFTYHTQYEEYSRAYLGVLSFSVRLFLRYHLKSFIESCDGVTTPSLYMAQRLTKTGINQHIEVIPNGIEEDLFSFSKRIPPFKTLKLIFVGRLGKEKNVLFLIKTFQELLLKFPLTELILIGDGPLKRKIEKLRKKLPFPENLKIKGAVPHDAIPKYLKKAHLFVTASKTEVHPLTVLEAMATGLPVIGLKVGGVKDILSNGGGVFAEENEAGFSKKILSVVRNPTFYQRLSKEAHRVAIRYFSKKSTDKLISFYQKVLMGFSQGEK